MYSSESKKFVMLTAFGKERVKVTVSTVMILDDEDLNDTEFPDGNSSVVQDYLYVPFPISEQDVTNTGFLCYVSKGKYKWRLWSKNKILPKARQEKHCFVTYETIIEDSFCEDSSDESLYSSEEEYEEDEKKRKKNAEKEEEKKDEL